MKRIVRQKFLTDKEAARLDVERRELEKEFKFSKKNKPTKNY